MLLLLLLRRWWCGRAGLRRARREDCGETLVVGAERCETALEDALGNLARRVDHSQRPGLELAQSQRHSKHVKGTRAAELDHLAGSDELRDVRLKEIGDLVAEVVEETLDVVHVLGDIFGRLEGGGPGRALLLVGARALVLLVGLNNTRTSGCSVVVCTCVSGRFSGCCVVGRVGI